MEEAEEDIDDAPSKSDTEGQEKEKDLQNVKRRQDDPIQDPSEVCVKEDAEPLCKRMRVEKA